MTDSRARSFAVLAVLLLATIVTAQTDTVWVRRLSGVPSRHIPVGVRLDRAIDDGRMS